MFIGGDATIFFIMPLWLEDSDTFFLYITFHIFFFFGRTKSSVRNYTQPMGKTTTKKKLRGGVCNPWGWNLSGRRGWGSQALGWGAPWGRTPYRNGEVVRYIEFSPCACDTLTYAFLQYIRVFSLQIAYLFHHLKRMVPPNALKSQTYKTQLFKSLILFICFYFIHFSRLNSISIILFWENTRSATKNYQIFEILN